MEDSSPPDNMGSIDSWPKIAQIEVTSHCNFECKMCIQHTWKETPLDMNLTLFEKVAEELFPHLDKVILYGLGEPLMHPNFLKILEISRKYLSPEGLIDFTTNGSLLTPDLADQILEYWLNRIIMSVDTSNLPKLMMIREGASDVIFTHLEHLASLRKQGKLNELAIETVIMRSNYHDLPNLVEFCSSMGIDSIYGSHILPHSKDEISESIYFTMSEESWAISSEICRKGWEFVSNVLFNPNENKFGNKSTKAPLLDQLRRMVEDGRREEIGFNPPLIYETFRKMALVDEVKRVFALSLETAQKYGVNLDLPPIFPSKSQRSCPFVKHDALMIKADGGITPCYNFSHDQCAFVNQHEQRDTAVHYGSVMERSVHEIWHSPDYAALRARLRDMDAEIPWCGDCTFSTNNCFYVASNESDCLGNRPGCHECLYSVNLVRCIFED